jgi:mannose-6-phosphate isomerase-like protein (cupin superfamily)
MEAPAAIGGDSGGVARGRHLMQLHLKVAAALPQLPTPEGKPFVELFAHGTLTVELYAPRGVDMQTPHSQDEVYVIARGTGSFRQGHFPDVTFGPGDVFFVPAGVEHRFKDFSDDMAAWVFFYGPKGGERE